MSIPFETKIDLKNPIWNRDAWARIQADLNPEKETICHCRGEVLGVKPGEAVKQLCNFETFLATRLIPQEDGTIRRLNKEVIFYTDARSNQIIHEWTNPWTGEVVPVVHVFNDPFNYTISEWLILAPEDFPKDGSKPEPRKIPLMFPWYSMGDDRLVLNTDMHLYYPNALQPDKWPRESGGKMAQVSEMMRYIVKREDLENPELTSVPMVGSWSRITPWLPWMLMGQTEGHCLYISTMTKSDNADIVPEHVREFFRKPAPRHAAGANRRLRPEYFQPRVLCQGADPGSTPERLTLAARLTLKSPDPVRARAGSGNYKKVLARSEGSDQPGPAVSPASPGQETS